MINACRLIALVSLILTSAVPAFARPLIGLNLSGCEFKTPGGVLCPTPADVRQAVGDGFNLIRLPFKGPQLDEPAVWNRIDAVVQEATRLGVYTILDRHDFKWPAVDEQIGSGGELPIGCRRARSLSST